MSTLHRDTPDDDVRRHPTPERGTGVAGPRDGRPDSTALLVDLQRLAGNRAVAALLGGRREPNGMYRRGPMHRHAAAGDVDDVAVEAAAEQVPAEGGEASELGATTAPSSVPTSSFTKVGPPTSTTYTVSGTLRKASETVAARTEAGATTTTPDLNSADDGTRMKHAQVTVTQVVELPDWSDRGSATANQQAEWDRFKAAITAHENGHVALDVKAFAGAHTKVLAKPTIAESNAEFDRITTQATTDNDAYDTANDHGRNAGTTLNPNIDEVTKVP